MTDEPMIPKEYATRYIERLIKALGPENQRDVAHQLRFLSATKRRPNTAQNLVIAVHTFDKLAGGARLADLEDVDAWSCMVCEYASSHTAASIRNTTAYLKAFLTRTRGEPLPKKLNEILSIREGREARDVIPITEAERDALLRAAGKAPDRLKAARDQALIWLLWDSGFRVGEAAALNVSSVRFDDQGGAHLIIPPKAEGLKTGPRTIYVVESAPALKVWLSYHPRQLEPDAPLFYAVYASRRVTNSGVTFGRILERQACTGKLTRHIWPHLFRHTRATRAAKGDAQRGIAGWSDAEMRAYFGWEPGSNMPAHYAHIAHRDMEERVRADANADPLAAMIRANPLDALAKLAGMTAAATLEEYRKAQAIDAVMRPSAARRVQPALLPEPREAAHDGTS